MVKDSRTTTLTSSTISDDVSAIQIDGHHYALVASSTVGRSDGGALVIVNITKHQQPLPRLEPVARAIGPTSMGTIM